ncbi:MAG: hypothetical protein IKU37_01410 [Candidatus Gastranaerophilales bacterium]|nr:hypothetical protein [Candidatus Gastranaerophilales bacterium]
MKLFKNYKKLYESELNNRKLYEEQYKKIYEENIDYQKEIKCYKEKCGRLTIDLEDVDGLLKQETEAKEELLKQRKKLRTMITKLGGDWKDAK